MHGIFLKKNNFKIEIKKSKIKFNSEICTKNFAMGQNSSKIRRAVVRGLKEDDGGGVRTAAIVYIA